MNKIESIDIPENLRNLTKELPSLPEKANVIDQYVGVKCPCDQHSCLIYILDCELIMVACKDKGALWLKRPPDLEKFKLAMTTPVLKQ